MPDARSGKRSKRRMSAGCPKKCIDRRVLLCYPDTTTDIAMIIVATIDVTMSVEYNGTGDWEGGFS